MISYARKSRRLFERIEWSGHSGELISSMRYSSPDHLFLNSHERNKVPEALHCQHELQIAVIIFAHLGIDAVLVTLNTRVPGAIAASTNGLIVFCFTFSSMRITTCPLALNHTENIEFILSNRTFSKPNSNNSHNS